MPGLLGRLPHGPCRGAGLLRVVFGGSTPHLVGGTSEFASHDARSPQDPRLLANHYSICYKPVAGLESGLLPLSKCDSFHGVTCPLAS